MLLLPLLLLLLHGEKRKERSRRGVVACVGIIN